MARLALSRSSSALVGIFLLLLLVYLFLRYSYSGPRFACRSPGLPLVDASDLSQAALARSVSSALHRRFTAARCRRQWHSEPWQLCVSRALYSLDACLVVSATATGGEAFEAEAKALFGCRVIVLRRSAMSSQAWLSEAIAAISEPIAILTLDIGHAAWDVLAAALESGAISQVRQLAVTLETRASGRADLVLYLRVLKGLEEKYGFQKWHMSPADPKQNMDRFVGERRRVTFVNHQLVPSC